MSGRDDYRRFLQETRRMTLDQFQKRMNEMHSQAWYLCHRQMEEAMVIALPPRYRDKFREKFKMIATQWDGLNEVTLDLQAFSEEEFMQVVRDNRRIGYGRMMQLISEHWRKQDPLGALSVGPCYGTLEKEERHG